MHGGSSDRDKKALSPLILYLNKLEEVKKGEGTNIHGWSPGELAQGIFPHINP